DPDVTGAWLRTRASEIGSGAIRGVGETSRIRSSLQSSEQPYRREVLLATTCETSSKTNFFPQASHATPLSLVKLASWQARVQKKENAPSRSSICQRS